MIQWLVVRLPDALCGLTLAVLLALAVRSMLTCLIRVDGSSMMPTLHHGDRVLCLIPRVRLRGVRRGEVVFCRYPRRGRMLFVKRVVAVPGDTVYKEGGVTHVVCDVGGHRVDRMLDPGRHSSRGASMEPYILDHGEYFVAGDNRLHSHDSRDWRRVGPIPGKMLTGRAVLVVWPPKHIRVIR